MTPNSPHIRIPNREIIPPPQKPLFPARRQVERASCMPTGLMIQRIPLKPKAVVPAPDNIFGSDLKAWFKPDATTIFTDSAGTTQVTADNDLVRHWANQADTSIDALSPNDGDRPKYRTNVQNGLPAIEFGNQTTTRLSADSLASTYFNPEDAHPWTLAMFFKLDATTDFKTLWCISGGVGTENLSLNPAFFLSNYQVFKSDGSTSDSATGGGTPDTNPNWIVITDSGTSVNAWLNGTQIMTNDACSKNGTGAGFWTIGALVRNTISGSTIGKIGEVIWANVEGDAGQVADLNAYGQATWATW